MTCDIAMNFLKYSTCDSADCKNFHDVPAGSTYYCFSQVDHVPYLLIFALAPPVFLNFEENIN